MTGPDGKAALTSRAATTAPAETELPIQLQPYKVWLSIKFGNDPALDSRYRATVLQTAAIRLRARLGQMWDLNVSEDQGGNAGSRRLLEGGTEVEFNEQFLPTGYDKVLLARVVRSGNRYQVDVREWDRSSQTVAPVNSGGVYDRRLVADEIAALAVRVFRPLAAVKVVEGKTVEVMIRAGEFLPADPSAVQFKPGDVLTAFARYLDRERKVRQIQVIPWTYLRVDSVERGRMVCSEVSAFKSPLSGARRRVELMALRANPLFPETRFKVVSAREPQNPQIGLRVVLMDRLPTAEDPVDDRVTQLTDRDGVVRVAADRERPLRYVYLYSGQSVLSRVPFIPGTVPEITFNAPDDSARLGVEGALSMLEGQIIDDAARRGVLMALARKSAKERQWPRVDEYVAQVKKLPGVEDVHRQLAAIQTPAVQAAQAVGDNVAESRLKQMCAKLKEVVDKNLDPDKTQAFLEEMAELRQVTGPAN